MYFISFDPETGEIWSQVMADSLDTALKILDSGQVMEVTKREYDIVEICKNVDSVIRTGYTLKAKIKSKIEM